MQSEETRSLELSARPATLARQWAAFDCLANMKVDWITPSFFDSRPCPACGCTLNPKPRYLYVTEPPFEAVCQRCGRATKPFPTWREALHAFHGEVLGRSPIFGPRAGDHFKVKDSEPIGCQPLTHGLTPGDVVRLLDYHLGIYTVQRERDGLKATITSQNIGEVVTR